jgi:hypothetical protein
MPEEPNPYASPTLIPHDCAPQPVDPLGPLRGSSIGLLVSAGLIAAGGLGWLPVLTFETFLWLSAPVKASVPEGTFAIPMFLASYPIAFGALHMRRGTQYRLAYAAAVFASMPMLTPLFCWGLPLGIWALIVLHRRNI